MTRRSKHPTSHPNVLADVLVGLSLVTATLASTTREKRPSEVGHARGGGVAPSTSKGGLLGRVDLFQQRRRWLGVPVAVVRKYGDDRAGRYVTMLAYYGFVSVFPALLALVTILGFVLQGHAGLRRDIADSALANFPIVGDTIASSVGGGLGGNTFALVIGLGGALWAGMGMAQAAQDAMNDVWSVARVEQPGFVGKRLRSAATLAAIGVAVVLSTALGQLVVVLTSGPIGTVAIFLASAVLDIALFAVAFRVLTVQDLSWRAVLPGAVFSGVAYAILQLLGGLYVSHAINGASETYGTFAVVIGLLSWILLIAQISVYGAEINVVLDRRLWPRSLFTEPVTPGDRRSHAQQAERERMDHQMDVDVEFRGARTTSNG